MAIASYQVRIARRIGIVTVLLLIVTVFAALATHHWVLELFSHFALFYAVFALLCALTLGLMGAWRWMCLAIALVLWNGYLPAQMLLTSTKAPAPQTTGQLTVFHFNVGVTHEQPSRVSAYLQRHWKEIDVIVLLEITNDFVEALEDLKDIYPYQIKHVEDSPFGIALASKIPIDFGAVALVPSEHFPHIEATLKLPGRAAPLALYALHAPPPLSVELATARNAKFDHIARLTAAQPAATPLVVGDFNVTPWSPYFSRFVAASGLRDARAPGRFDNTWPVTFDNANLGIAIDHTFAHPSLPLIKRTVGPDLGSDHLPVTATFGY